jgi:hypothetical protein
MALPDSQLISVEIDSTSEDVPIAEARLSTRRNVHTVFGDSRRVIPSLLEWGDIVLIDGPKAYRSVRFALVLLQTGKLRGVFVHDLYSGASYRRFVERWMPEAVFSDSEEFMEVAHSINRGIAGPDSCLAYIPRVEGRQYWALRLMARFEELAGSLARRTQVLKR